MVNLNRQNKLTRLPCWAKQATARFSIANPIVDSALRYPGYLRPFKDGAGFSIYGDAIGSAPIQRLLAPGGPSAVSRLVIPKWIRVAINTVVQRWASSHVFNECSKRIGPPVTQQNSAPSVLREYWIIWIAAALLHALPDIPFRRVPKPMSSRSRYRPLSVKATARLRVARSKAINIYRNHVSAIANTVSLGVFTYVN